MHAQPDDLKTETQADDNLRAVDDLTLSELLSAFTKQPRQTFRAFTGAIQDNKSSNHMVSIASDTTGTAEQKTNFVSTLRQEIINLVVGSRIFGYTFSFLIVLMGNSILAGQVGMRRSEDIQLAQGTPFLIVGILIWLITEIFFSRDALRTWWQNRNTQASSTNASPQIQQYDVPWYEKIPLSRFVVALFAVITSTWTFIFTANNTFTTPTFYIWLVSIALWVCVVTRFDFNLFDWATTKVDRWRSVQWQSNLWVIVCLVIVMLVAGYFRFYDLNNHPLEMTDDHVEKILDAGRVRDGARNIFFANNGGREPTQMYLIALVSHLPTFGINHDTIKFVSSMESLLTIPALFWMGYAIFEGESKRRRLLIGLVLASLVAISYWHVAITRQGLRIPLTALIVSLQLIYLLRGIRHNRRSDFIISGLILGFGLYTYQAVRMLPIVIVVAVVIAILFKAKTLKQRVTYIVNLSVLVAISFSVFIPLFRYSIDEPEMFWRRTTGRLLGDDVIQELLDDGTVIYRDASVQDRFDAFVSHVPTIASNIRNVLLMFNWEGDIATISGVSNRPAMDIWSASLLLVGVAAWLTFAIRKKDTVYWLIPIIAFLMLLPSALSIAFPHENPSHTRTSGAIPMIYLMTALPLVLMIEQLLDYFKQWRGYVASALVCILLFGGSFNANNHLYFDVYRQRYEESFNPYSDAGRYLYGYVLTGGAYGNAFLIGYEHWWSHRAIGLEGGLEENWVGGIYPYIEGQYSTDPIIQSIYNNLSATGTFQFQPTANLLFFYSPNDTDTAQALVDLFPSGFATERTTYNPNETFMTYEVPALGNTGLQEWVTENPPIEE